MTLVVANLIENQISIVSDTALSTEMGGGYYNRHSPFASVLKILILEKDICVCFAGTAEYGLETIKKLKEIVKNLSIDEILGYLLAEHLKRDKDARPDFMVASVRNDNPTLHKISDGTINKNLLTCWIGSQHAFGLYQELFHKHKESARQSIPNDLLSCVSFAMRMAINELIDIDKDDTIGGFAIFASSTKLGFEYMNSFYSAIPTQKMDLNFDEWTSMKLAGNAHEGGYTCTILTPKEIGISAIGIYIYQPRLGIFIHPFTLEKNLVIKGASHQQFVDYIKSQYYITLEGTQLN